MKDFLKNILLVTVPTLIITILLLELILSFLMPLPSRPETIYDQPTDILKFSPESGTGTYTKGKFFQIRADWSINNAGWNSLVDYKADTEKDRIAIIGDSYVEALQVDVDEKYAHLMRNMLGPDTEVYSFGKSLYALPQYLHVSRHVVETYNPSTLIINVVHNDFEESLEGEGADLRHQALMQLIVGEDSTITERSPYYHPYLQQRLNPGWVRSLMLKSRLQRYIRYPDFLGIQPFRMAQGFLNQSDSDSDSDNEQKDPQYEANVNVEEIDSKEVQIRLATEYVIRTIREENPDKKIIFVMDTPRGFIYRDVPVENSGVYWLHQLMEEMTTKYDVGFIDLTSVMKKDYLENGKEFNSEVDTHWNEHGHQLVAKTLTEYLKSHP